MGFTNSSSFRAALPDSPFLDNLPSFLSSTELKALLGGNAVTLNPSQLSKLVEEGDIDDVKQFDYFIWNDDDPEFDEAEDTVSFYITIFYCRNAIKLEELYDITVPQDAEFLLFIEDQTGDKLSGRKIYIKIGTDVQTLFKNDLSNTAILGETVAEAIGSVNVGNTQVGPNVGNAIVKIVEASFGEIESVSQLSAFLSFAADAFLHEVRKATDFAFDIPIGILQSITGEIRSWEYTPNDWDPSTATPGKDFVPKFFPLLKFKRDRKAYFNIEGQDIAVNDVKDALLQTIGQRFKSFNAALDVSYILLLEKLEDLTFGLADFKATESPLHGLVESLSDIFQGIIGFLLEQAGRAVLFANALICGLINSLIEILAGIFDIIQLIFMLMKASTNMTLEINNWTEYLDNLVQTLKQIDLKAVLQRVNTFIQDFFSNIGDAIWAWFGSLSSADIGYFIGFLIGFIIEQVLEALFTAGIGNAAAIVRNTVRGTKAAMDLIFDIMKKAMKEIGAKLTNVGGGILDIVEAFLRFIRQAKTEGLMSMLDRLWEAFMRWIDEVRGISKAVIRRYAKKFKYEFNLRPKLTPNKALKVYGQVGKKLVIGVDNKVAAIIAASPSNRALQKKTMVSGMIYKKGNNLSEVYAYPNFTKDEIGEASATGRFLGNDGKRSVYQKFLDEMHPTLRERLREHREHSHKVQVDVKIKEKAGELGSHGEIRALNDLLWAVDKEGKLGDAVFKDIYAYNRYLRSGAFQLQPRCFHCRYITDGIRMVF